MIHRTLYVQAVLDTSSFERGMARVTGHMRHLTHGARVVSAGVPAHFSRASQAVERYASSLGRASYALEAHREQAARLSGALGSVARAYGHVVAVVGGAAMAFGRLSQAISQGIALQAQYEQAVLKLSSIMRRQGEDMAQTQARVEGILAYAREWAARTPYSTQDAIQVISMASPMVKGDEEALKRILDLSALLAAKEPMWGLTGATYAIIQALSEDYVSLQDRFNIPRSIIHKLRGQGLRGLALVEAALKEAGLSMDLINQQATTLVGLQGRIEDYTKIIYSRLGEGPFAARKAYLERVAARLEAMTQEGSLYMRGVGVASAALGKVAEVYYRLLDLPGLAAGWAIGMAGSLAQAPTVAATVEALQKNALGLWNRAGEWWATAIPKARAELTGLATVLGHGVARGVERLRQEWELLKQHLTGAIEPVKRLMDALSARTGLSPSTLVLLAAGVLSLAVAFRVLGGALTLPVRLLGAMVTLGRRGGRASLVPIPSPALLAAAGAGYAAQNLQLTPMALEAAAGLARGVPANALERNFGREAVWQASQALSRLETLVDRVVRGLVRLVAAAQRALTGVGQTVAAVAGVFAPIGMAVGELAHSGAIREAIRLLGNLAETAAQLVQAAAPFAEATVKLAVLVGGGLLKAVSTVLTPILQLLNAFLDFIQSANPVAQAFRTIAGAILGVVGGVAALAIAVRGLRNLFAGIRTTLADELSDALGLRPRWQSALWTPGGGGGGGLTVSLNRRTVLGRIWQSIFVGPVNEFGLPESPGRSIWSAAGNAVRQVLRPVGESLARARRAYYDAGGSPPGEIAGALLSRLDRTGRIARAIEAFQARVRQVREAREAERAAREERERRMQEAAFWASPTGRLTAAIMRLTAVMEAAVKLWSGHAGRLAPPAPHGKRSTGGGGPASGGTPQGGRGLPPRPNPFYLNRPAHLPERGRPKRREEPPEPMGKADVDEASLGFATDFVSAFFSGQGIIGALVFALQGVLAQALAPVAAAISSALSRALSAGATYVMAVTAPAIQAASSWISSVMTMVLGRVIGDALMGNRWMGGLLGRLKPLGQGLTKAIWTWIMAALGSDFARGVLAKGRAVLLAAWLQAWAGGAWMRSMAGRLAPWASRVSGFLGGVLAGALTKGRGLLAGARAFSVAAPVVATGSGLLTPVLIGGLVAAVLAAGGYALYRWVRSRAESGGRGGGGGQGAVQGTTPATRPLTWWERVTTFIRTGIVPPTTPPALPQPSDTLTPPGREAVHREIERTRTQGLLGRQGYRITAGVKDHQGRAPGVDIVPKGKGYLYAPVSGQLEYILDISGFGRRDRYGLSGYGLLARIRDAQGRELYIGHLRPDYLPQEVQGAVAHHLARIREYQRQGLRHVTAWKGQVQAGTYLGMYGNTGNSTGPHVHLGVRSPSGEWVRDDRAILMAFGLAPSPVSRVKPTSEQRRAARDGTGGGGELGGISVSMGDIAVNVQVGGNTAAILSEVEKAIARAQEKQRRELLAQLARELKARGY